MDRKKASIDVEAAVLLRSCRRCTLCFHLHGDLSEKRGQIAHLNRDPSDSAEDNLAWMCLDHHTLYDSRTSQHKNYAIQEIKQARAKLYEVIGRRQSEAQRASLDLVRRPGNEDGKPIAVVELGKRESASEVVCLCYNLGNAPFVIDKLIVNIQGGVTSHSDFVGPYVVRPDDFVVANVDCAEWLNASFREANIVFQLKGAAGILTTEPVWFYFYPEPAVGYGWRVGRLADRQPGVIVSQPRIIPGGQ
jgi:hypothetical protein